MSKCFHTFAAAILILGTLTPTPTYSYEPVTNRKFDSARAKECKDAKDRLLSQLKKVELLASKFPKDAATLREGKEVLQWKADLKKLCVMEEDENKKYMQFDLFNGRLSENIDDLEEFMDDDSKASKETTKTTQEKLERVKKQSKEIREKMDEAAAEAIELEARQRAVYIGTEKGEGMDHSDQESESDDDYTEVTPEMRSLPKRLNGLVKSIKKISREEKKFLQKLAAHAEERIRAFELGKRLTEADKGVRQLVLERATLSKKLKHKKKPKSGIKTFFAKLKGKSEAQQMADLDAKTSVLSDEIKELDKKLDPLIMESGNLNQAIEEALWPNRGRDKLPNGLSPDDLSWEYLESLSSDSHKSSKTKKSPG